MSTTNRPTLFHGQISLLTYGILFNQQQHTIATETWLRNTRSSFRPNTTLVHHARTRDRSTETHDSNYGYACSLHSYNSLLWHPTPMKILFYNCHFSWLANSILTHAKTIIIILWFEDHTLGLLVPSDWAVCGALHLIWNISCLFL